MNLMERNQLSIYTFNYMLRIYSKEPAVYQRDAEKLFKELTSKKYIAMPTALTYALMIQLYAKRGLYPEAEVIFSQMLKNNEIVLEPVCFDALILAYVKGNASQEKMENIVQEMERRYLKPTIVTYALLMEGCLHTKDSERLQGYLKKIAELGMEPNLRIYTSLLKMANLEEKPHTELVAVYRKMLLGGVTPDTMLYSVLFEACVRCDARDVALSLFNEMLKLEVLPNLYAIKLLGLTSLEVLNRMNELSAQVSPKLYNMLLTQACKTNDFSAAFKITTHMHQNGCQPSVHAYGILMEAHVKMGNSDKAFGLLEELKQKGLEPDGHIYRTLIEGLYTSADIQRALKLADEADKAGVSNMYIYNTLLGLCSRTKNLEQAKAIFKAMKSRGIHPVTRSYNHYLSLTTSYSNFVDAWDIYLEMCNKDCIPDRVTYNIMLRSCTDQMDYLKSLRIFDDMKRSEDFFPTSVNCSDVMRLLAVLNRKPLAFEVWMGFISSPRAQIQDVSVSLFLNLCQNAKRPKLAISSFEVLKSRVLTDKTQAIGLHPATYLLYLRILAIGGHFATFQTAFADANPVFGVQLVRGHLETLRGFFVNTPPLCKAFHEMLQTLPEGEFVPESAAQYLTNPFPKGLKALQFRVGLPKTKN